MGIHGLMNLISDVAPSAAKESKVSNYFGRKVAIDASMSLYQFLIAVRSDGSQLTNASGEITSHLMGIFHRTIRLVDNGIKPVYVFDGKPPQMKSSELDKRAERREEAEKALAKAEESGDAEEVQKFTRRLVKVTKEHVEECKELLKLMGIPFIDAPGEAEAQCAALVKAGKVYATATEDMDALTFGSNILLRHLTASEAKKIAVQEINLAKILSELELSQKEFIDLCILLGCDYCESIKGIGPKRAMELIKKHRNLETVISTLDKKYSPPENWLFKEARQLFLTPDVTDPETIELKWSEPDIEGIVNYLCKEKMFKEDRVRTSLKKFTKARTAGTQGRIDSFITVTPCAPNPKRKAEEKAKAAKKPKLGHGKRGGK